VGWDIDIRSEEEMRREIAQQMERLITAPVVPLTLIEGITPADTEVLLEHGIETIEQLAEVVVDDVSDWLDLSIDEADELIEMARSIVDARTAKAQEVSALEGEPGSETELSEQESTGAAEEETAPEAAESESEADGGDSGAEDEAVEIVAEEQADNQDGEAEQAEPVEQAEHTTPTEPPSGEVDDSEAGDASELRGQPAER
jgi:hypothetical protein